jgi:hypothetical protein
VLQGDVSLLHTTRKGMTNLPADGSNKWVKHLLSLLRCMYYNANGTTRQQLFTQ